MSNQAPPPPPAAPETPESGHPVPPQPGAPVPPPFTPDGTAGPVFTPPEPAKKKSGKKRLAGIVGFVVVAAVVAVGKTALGDLLGGEDKTAEAKVGDCIAALPEVDEGEEKDAPNAKVVDCTSTEAAYTVAGRFDNQTEEQAKTANCEQYAAAGEAFYTFYAIRNSGTGYVLCLLDKKA